MDKCEVMTSQRLEPGCTLNVGILGHVDSGKTSLARALSTVLSTAALDKSRESKERGITLDLGFSGFQMKTKDGETVMICLVDCPGHCSLLKTIIGGAHIIDMVLLVIDVNKGIQVQTVESFALCEILHKPIIIVLTKVDLISKETRSLKINQMQNRLRQAFRKTIFGENVPIVAVSPIGSVSVKAPLINCSPGEAPNAIEELVALIRNSAVIPKRATTDSFSMAYDHCFLIKGRGCVVTGTLLTGKVRIDDTVMESESELKSKVRSIQSFKMPMDEAVAGDRVALALPAFNATLERGLLCSPDFSFWRFTSCIAQVSKVRYFKHPVPSRSRYHCTLNHKTVLCTIVFFGGNVDSLDLTQEYYPVGELKNQDTEKVPNGSATIFALLTFDRPFKCSPNCLLICSKLDANVNECRIAFYGKLLRPITEETGRPMKPDAGIRTGKTATPVGIECAIPLSSLSLVKEKVRSGRVEKLKVGEDDRALLVSDLFKSLQHYKTFEGAKVELVLSSKKTLPKEDYQKREAQIELHRLPGVVHRSFGGKGKCICIFQCNVCDWIMGHFETNISPNALYNNDARNVVDSLRNTEGGTEMVRKDLLVELRYKKPVFNR